MWRHGALVAHLVATVSNDKASSCSVILFPLLLVILLLCLELVSPPVACCDSQHLLQLSECSVRGDLRSTRAPFARIFGARMLRSRGLSEHVCSDNPRERSKCAPQVPSNRARVLRTSPLMSTHQPNPRPSPTHPHPTLPQTIPTPPKAQTHTTPHHKTC